MRKIRVTLAVILCLLLGGAGEARARKRPKNPKHRRAETQRRKHPARKSVKKKKRPGRYLRSKRWDPEVRRALETLIDVHGSKSAGYDPQRPPTAVIALNDTALVNDLGLAVFKRLVERVEFKFGDEFWDLVPVGFGRRRLRSRYERFRTEPVSSWKRQPAYHQYRRQFFRSYRDICRRRSRKECRAFLASLWKGFTVGELRGYARDAVREALAAPVDAEMLQERPGDADPVIMRTGLRLVPELKNLVLVLTRFGFDVRLISDDARLLVSEMAAEFGLEAEKAIGLEVGVSSVTSVISGQVFEPVTVGSGRVAALIRRVDRDPLLIVGGHYVDIEMLQYGRGTRLLIDHGDSAMREIAAEKRWLVQPAFERP